MDAFGRLTKMTSIVQRMKDEEFELIYKEYRYQPFWHIKCRANYVYQRRKEFPVTLGGPEVKTVTIEGMEYQADGGMIKLTGMEHCQEEYLQDVFIDGLTNQEDPNLSDYLQYTATQIPQEALKEFGGEGKIVVPPQARASALVREILIGMIKDHHIDAGAAH